MSVWEDYARGVDSGAVPSGELMRLAARRFLDDLGRGDLEFRGDLVERAVRFIGLLRHFKGDSAGKPFTLEPWQQFIVANILGFYVKATGRRRYVSSYLEVSRKQGKTALAAALCTYFMIGDGVDGAEVMLAANSFEQAKIAYEFCAVFARQLDPRQKSLKVMRDRVLLRRNNSKLIVCSSDSDKLDGHQPYFGLIDEYHAAPTTKTRDVIKSGMNLPDSHLMVITTAGFNKAYPCHKLRTTCAEVLRGLKEDDGMFVAIYAMDDGDDWRDESAWPKCVPNLGVTVTMDYIRQQVQAAVNNPQEETGVRTKTLNQWCDTQKVWLPDSLVMAATGKVDLKAHAGRRCWVGVDLASVSDMSAVCYLFEGDDGRLVFKTDYYLPAESAERGVNREWYAYLARTGQLTLTPGNVTDYDYITRDLQACPLRVGKIGYDPWNSTSWATRCTELGMPLDQYFQNIGNLTKPTKELQRLLLCGKAILDDNECTRWMFRNVAMKEDVNENIRPVKGAGPEGKIDGIIAMVIALGERMTTPNFGNKIFVI